MHARVGPGGHERGPAEPAVPAVQPAVQTLSIFGRYAVVISTEVVFVDTAENGPFEAAQWCIRGIRGAHEPAVGAQARSPSNGPDRPAGKPASGSSEKRYQRVGRDRLRTP